ncbi:hypothetical protein [Miniimonas sp. S16]|uniref:hypothetical protein n=1 Tax=Miniimonas sp. S16 TaxID=2171623 RepID=UPI00131EF1C0|nr:hypothetical protein [Miniimonas sp. S16]
MGMFGKHPGSVRQFQVRQDRDYAVRVLVVEGDDVDARGHIEEAVAGFRRQLHEKVPVRVEYVDALPSTNGKLQYVISEVEN